MGHRSGWVVRNRTREPDLVLLRHPFMLSAPWETQARGTE